VNSLVSLAKMVNVVPLKVFVEPPSRNVTLGVNDLGELVGVLDLFLASKTRTPQVQLERVLFIKIQRMENVDLNMDLQSVHPPFVVRHGDIVRMMVAIMGLHGVGKVVCVGLGNVTDLVPMCVPPRQPHTNYMHQYSLSCFNSYNIKCMYGESLSDNFI
jgi:hypothetical protein